MTERRAWDVIRVNERIFVRSFVKPKNIRLLGFDIRFTTSIYPRPLRITPAEKLPEFGTFSGKCHACLVHVHVHVCG